MSVRRLNRSLMEELDTYLCIFVDARKLIIA